jgi:threonine dehydrogenase-like Zn-dependent dehydrogenase
MDLAEIRGGEKIAIFGGGSMGMLMVQLVKEAGASEVVLITRQKTRRDVAMQIGATRTIDPRAEEVSKVLADMDIAFEVAGVSETFHQSCEVVRAGGTVIILGVAPAHEKVQFSVYDFLVKGIKIVASYLNPATQGRAAEMISAGKLNLDALISKAITLDELPTFLEAEPGQGDIKYVVKGA